jgi:phosphoribosyl-ATP pyrophosphohydrolase
MKNKASKTGSFKSSSFKSNSFKSKPFKSAGEGENSRRPFNSRPFKSEGEGENSRRSFKSAGEGENSRRPFNSRPFKSEGGDENSRNSFQDNQPQKKYIKKTNNSRFGEELMSNSKAKSIIQNKRNHNSIIENSTRNHHFSIENLAKLLYQKINHQNNKTNPYDKEDSKKSYTAELHNGGVARITRKIGEESTEVIIAAFINQQRDNQKSKQDLINEVCDLFYHTLILLASSNISFDKILDELYKRNVQK